MEWKEKERIFVERMDKKKLMHKQKKLCTMKEKKIQRTKRNETFFAQVTNQNLKFDLKKKKIILSLRRKNKPFL